MYKRQMMTYLGMTMPMAVVALISWMRNPYNGNQSEVKIHRLSRREWGVMWILTIIVTIGDVYKRQVLEHTTVEAVQSWSR